MVQAVEKEILDQEEDDQGENKPEEKEPSFDLGTEFIESGGQVFAWYPNSGPAVWKCGRGKDGEPIDPKGMQREALHYLNERGEWEAGNPDEELLAEIKRWRSDWMDLK